MQLDSYIHLGIDGIRYLESTSANAGCFTPWLQELPLSKGRVEAWLPEYIDTERALAFNGSGLNFRDDEGDFVEAYNEETMEDATTIEELDQGAYRVVCEFLKQEGSNLFTLRSQLRPEEIDDADLIVPHFIIQNEVHLYCTGAHFRAQPTTGASFDMIDEIFDHADTQAIGLLTQTHPNMETQLNKASVNQLFSKLSHLIVEAYNGESWLVWSCHRSPTRPDAI